MRGGLTGGAVFLALDGVHVEHVHAVLHAGPGAGVAHCPAHHARHAPLPELGEELRVEVHSAGCLLRGSITTRSRNIGKIGILRKMTLDCFASSLVKNKIS